MRFISSQFSWVVVSRNLIQTGAHQLPLYQHVIIIELKALNFMTPFYGSSSTELGLLRRGSLLFATRFFLQRNFWYSFYWPWNDERLSGPWSHPVVLDTGSLDWESSALTTRPYLSSKCWVSWCFCVPFLLRKLPNCNMYFLYGKAYSPSNELTDAWYLKIVKMCRKEKVSFKLNWDVTRFDLQHNLQTLYRNMVLKIISTEDEFFAKI